MDNHSRSLELAETAERYYREGKLERAKQEYVLAAEAELAALNETPRSDIKGYGRLVSSVAALLYRAGDRERALAFVNKHLQEKLVPSTVRAQLNVVKRAVSAD